MPDSSNRLVSLHVQAAGGVLWHRAADGGLEVALVHRPRYDDWSLPKGKAEAGEHPVLTAVREIAEETGQQAIIGRPLGTSSYDVLVARGPARKTVRWYAVQAVGDGPITGQDVDEVRWLRPGAAVDLLTQGRDGEVLRRFLAGPPDPALVLLVRHAKAGDSDPTELADELRPLVPAGWSQARDLAPVLAAFTPTRIVSAPVLRCRQTVEPLSELLDIATQVEQVLGEDHHARHRHAAASWVRSAARRPSAVLCSQGGLIPDVLRALHPALREPVARKASTWVLAFQGDHPLSADLLEG